MSRKSRRELELEIYLKDVEIKKLQHRIDFLDKKFEIMSELEDSTPTDCKKGVWCKTCQFVRVFHNIATLDIVYTCGKGECCNHYIQKEV